MSFGNYAILLFKGHNRFCNFCKPHFSNITRGETKSIKGFGRIEIDNILKILTEKVFFRISAEPFHCHIRHAVCDSLFVNRTDSVLVQFLQETVVGRVKQISDIIRDIIFRRISCSTKNCRSKRTLIFNSSKGAFKCFNNFFLVLRLHRPNGNGARVSAFVSVGNIEIMNKPLMASAYIVKYRYARSTFVYPSSERFVPTLNFKNGGCVRSLGKYKQLFVKAKFVVSASRSQKGLPIFR